MKCIGIFVFKKKKYIHIYIIGYKNDICSLQLRTARKGSIFIVNKRGKLKSSKTYLNNWVSWIIKTYDPKKIPFLFSILLKQELFKIYIRHIYSHPPPSPPVNLIFPKTLCLIQHRNGYLPFSFFLQPSPKLLWLITIKRYCLIKKGVGSNHFILE